MNLRKRWENWIQGWLPEEGDNDYFKRIVRVGKTNRKLKFSTFIGLLVIILIGVIFFSYSLLVFNPIYPTDVKIIDTLIVNKDFLLSNSEIIGAGIARNSSNNHIIGISLFVKDTPTNIQEISSALGDFALFIKKINVTNGIETSDMIIYR